MWQDKGVIFSPGVENFDNISVKDPTVVFFNDRCHIFYTAIGLHGNERKITTAYVSTDSLYGLDSSPRLDLATLWMPDVLPVVAPQVFYYSFHNKWYLVAQSPYAGPGRNLPVFCTNDDISNPAGWSSPKILLGQEKCHLDKWIDFWIIADDHQVWMFYTDQQANVWAMVCQFDEFPGGFKLPRIVCSERHDDKWEIHEASHVYRDADTGEYLMLVEGYHHGSNESFWLNYMDRFMHAYHADDLAGPWMSVGSQTGRFWADRSNVISQTGVSGKISQVSHPELIRIGYDEKMLIRKPYQMISQEHIPDCHRDYFNLHWQFHLLEEI